MTFVQIIQKRFIKFVQNVNLQLNENFDIINCNKII